MIQLVPSLVDRSLQRNTCVLCLGCRYRHLRQEIQKYLSQYGIVIGIMISAMILSCDLAYNIKKMLTIIQFECK